MILKTIGKKKLPHWGIILLIGTASMVSAQTSNPYFAGAGGQGMTLAVLEPVGKGLSESEQWMLPLIQGSLTANFNKFSAMTVVDRQHIEKIMADIARAMESGYYSDETMVKIGQMTNARYVLAGVVSKTATAFSFELAVTDAQSGERKASFPPRPVSPLALENNSATNEATADLLKQLGISLTAAGLSELNKTVNMNKVWAEAALAKGMAAQRQGTQVAALSYFYQAAVLDPTLADAVSRSQIISADITSGNIGADVRNDIAWRREWVVKLTEFEKFFYEMINASDPPYTLFYSAAIEQGKINYQTESVDMSIPVNLRANKVWMNSVTQTANTVYSELNTGLNTTGRKDAWGLANWPRQGITNTNPFAQWKDKRYDISVAFEILSDSKKVIGKQTLRLTPAFSLRGDGDRIVSNFTENTFNTVAFGAVSANDITDNLTIRVASVNGDKPENARFGIKALSGAKWQKYRSDNDFSHLRIENGTILGFNPSLNDWQRQQHKNITMPSEFWGEPITSIGDYAFQKSELTGVTIPDGITSIGAEAFMDNSLTGVIIPNSVTSIGDKAFAFNPLTGVNIPRSVKIIGRDAFNCNTISMITIGSDVPLGENITHNGDFAADYNANGRKAGTYRYCTTCEAGRWFGDENQLYATLQNEDAARQAALQKENAEREAALQKENAEREATLRKEKAAKEEAYRKEKEENNKIQLKPKIGCSVGFVGYAWSSKSLNESFGFELDNRNGSTYNSGAICFNLGLAFTIPFSRRVAFVGEANYNFYLPDSGASEYDEEKNLPEGSSDYIRDANIGNFPLLLRFHVSDVFQLETGGQFNILSAANREKQTSSISNYGFIAGIGGGVIGLGGVYLRFSINSNNYYTAMLMFQYFWGGKNWRADI